MMCDNNTIEVVPAHSINQSQENIPLSGENQKEMGFGGMFGEFEKTFFNGGDCVTALRKDEGYPKGVSKLKKGLEPQMDMHALTEQFKELSPDALDRVFEFTKLPEDQQKQALVLLEQYNTQAEGDPDQKRFEEIKARYKPFPENKKMEVAAILSHLKDQLGSDLKYFGALEDRIYMNELEKIEPLKKKMYDTLYYAHRQNSSAPSMKEIIPKITEKVTKRLKNFKVTEKTTLNEYYRNKSAEYTRKTQHHSLLSTSNTL